MPLSDSARFRVLKVSNPDGEGDAEGGEGRQQQLSNSNSNSNSNQNTDQIQAESNAADDSPPSPDDEVEAMFTRDYYNTCGDVLPKPSNYRALTEEMFKRPTIDELHQGAMFTAGDSAVAPQTNLELLRGEAVTDTEAQKKVYQPIKLGWIKGILIRCILTIWGVLLFVRLTWIVGQAGLCLATVIIMLSMIVTLITTMSLSAICTNGEVLGGGIYFLVSRCLGAELGSIVGVIFSFANTVSAAMHTVGFAETVVDILQRYGITITGDAINDVRVVGCITVVFLLGIAIIGVRWESIAQVILMVLLIGALINFGIGSFIPPTEQEKLKGFVGFNKETLVDNFMSDFREGHTFFTTFSIFFPAATGILSGVNISGDLKDPSSAVPKGTFLAIFITSGTYLLVAWLAGGSVVREIVYTPDGLPSTANSTYAALDALNSTSIALNGTIAGKSVAEPKMYGLLHDMQVIEMMSWYGPVIFAGIFAASLSSALAALVSAPKLFQVVCKDRLFPFVHVFAKEYGRDREPRRAYLLCAFLALCFTSIGQLNVIGPVVSNFFMVTYIFVNYACFDASTSKAPGWRPGFKYYNRWVSLLGALMCLTIVFIMSWWSGLLTFLIAGFIWYYVHYSKPPTQANWGSSRDANTYRSAVSLAHRLVWLNEHVKNFRPQVLVLCGEPHKRPQLVDLANALTKDVGLLVCANVVQDETDSLRYQAWKLLSCEGYTYLRHRKIKGFYDVVISREFRDGAKCILQAAGLGKLRPNIVLLGYKENWHTRCGQTAQEVEDFANVIHDAFDLHYGVAVLRLNNGFDSRELDGVTLSEFLELDIKAHRLYKATQRARRHMRKRLVSGASFGTITTFTTSPDGKQSDEPNPVRTPTKVAQHLARRILPSVSTISSSSSSSDDEEPPKPSLMRRNTTRNKRVRTSSTDTEQEQEEDRLKKRRHTLLETLKRRRDSLFKGDLPEGDGGDGKREAKTSLHLRPSHLTDSRMTINIDVVEEVASTAESASSSSQQIHRISRSALNKDSRLPGLRPKYVDDSGEMWHDVINRFIGRQKGGFIDIWWLFDDGGLTLLLPHILASRSNWDKTKLRIITQPTSEQTDDEQIAQDRRKMLELFAKFRFEVDDVRVLRMNDPPSARTVAEYERLIEAWKQRPTSSSGNTDKQPWHITNEDLQASRVKTMRYLRIRELLCEYSSDAQLIVLTLPVPRKGLKSALYFSWLEMLTRDLSAPVLLVRGNQQTVLTYYYG